MAIDGLSSGRYVDCNIIRCGSSTVTMEVALQVRPAMAIIGGEFRAKGITLSQLVESITQLVTDRFNDGIRSATILVSDKFYECLSGFDGLSAE